MRSKSPVYFGFLKIIGDVDLRHEVMVHSDFISFGPRAQIVWMFIEMQTGQVQFEPMSFSDKKPTTWFWI